MNLAPQSASLRLANPRKQKLMEEIEASLDEAERWRKINAAYHADDIKFMRFLIPPGKRVLELGCGTGDLLAALEPSYGVGVDFGAETLAHARRRAIPHLDFVLGDVEDPATLNGDRRAVRLHRDRRHHRHVRGHRRHAAADLSALRAVDPYRHFLLLASVGADAEDARKRSGCGASSRRSTTSRPPTSST